MADGNGVVSIRDRLLKERQALLDLSSRNRLLNTPLRTRNNRALEIVDEKSTEVFRLLTAGKSMTFLPGAQLSAEERAALDPDDDVTGGIPQPEDDAPDERGVASRHSDNKLQTRLTSEGLQKRLFDIWYDAQTLEQDQGVNILYLAIGLLKWFDADNSETARHAPLVLLPVKLERSSAADRFKLSWREEPPSPNLTLQAKMKVEFGLEVDDFRDEDDVDLSAYCARVAESVSGKSRWQVLPDAMVLGFFSFSKFLMYRDLDPANWPDDGGIDAHPMVSALLRDGFPQSEPLVADGAPIDEAIPASAQHHVVDADSSQAVAIAEAAEGRTLVVKGPPGTGKSQTITNIIAGAVARGKKVLFVAEKMAALEVVQRNLRRVGLAPLTLELHSNKANKKSILEELRRTRDAQLKVFRTDPSVVDKLSASRAALNAFAQRLHQPMQPSGLSAHTILGRLSRSQSHGLPAYPLSLAANWTPEDVDARRALLTDVCDSLDDIGPPGKNAWRGVTRGAVDPVERQEIAGRIRFVESLVREASQYAQQATTELGCPAATTLGALSINLTYLQASITPVGFERARLSSPIWTQGISNLRDAIAKGRSFSAIWPKIQATFNEAGQSADYAILRSTIAAKGEGLFRFLDKAFCEQAALFRSYLKSGAPKRNADRVALIDQIMEAQRIRSDFAQASLIGAEAFGSSWRGGSSDWDSLSGVVDWREANNILPSEFWGRLASTSEDVALTNAATTLDRVLPQIVGALKELIGELALDVQRAFGVTTIGDLPLQALLVRFAEWTADLEGLSRYIIYAAQARQLHNMGCGRLVEALEAGSLNGTILQSTFEGSYSEALRVSLFNSWPDLKGFDGVDHNKKVDRFRELDQSRVKLAQEQLVTAHAEGRPRGAAGIGPLGVLNAEISRKRGHLPIRTLLEKAGPAIQQLKPVFMMSPLSVARFLKPGSMMFDILVMDEASQIEPVDALGAIARVHQLVVVGDERQLPPTAFFKKLAGEEDIDEGRDEVTIQAKDAESILELCLAKGVPHRMLSWHYRSKHQSLIAVSNREFYENKLFIVPSPYDATAGMGLRFNLLRDAPYDRGGTRTNAVEARVIAEAVIRHARETPEQSLGVATFSVAQRQAVWKELELLRRSNPDVEEFFGAASTEPFFVKNLENIQGDERDVIFISVGYGKTAEGYLAHAFGPLSGEGGERRLNVLISRAKLRCEVFCNFTGADIDLERSRARGVAALKLFLTFAETGHFGLGEETGADFDSDFEAQVCERLQSLGHDVKRQIGASGFRVDLAVGDAERPGRYVLGIECDGAQFHSSRSARDRDRLRQQVLEAHGWIIHRVWSADWYLRPEEEIRKIEEAIQRAKATWRDRDETGVRPQRAAPVSFAAETNGEDDILVAIMDGLADTKASSPWQRYEEASFRVNRKVEPHETPQIELSSHVARIVELEGPVHIDEVIARIRTLWGLGRAGSRIRGAVQGAAEEAVRSGRVFGREFLDIPGREPVVRDRSEVQSLTLRKPEMLPPSEVNACMLRLVDINFGASRPDLVQAAGRAFGYASISGQLRAVLAEGIDRLIEAEELCEKDDLIVRPKAH